jgi:hypothetical protein
MEEGLNVGVGLFEGTGVLEGIIEFHGNGEGL